MHPRWYYAFPIGVAVVAGVGAAIGYAYASDDLAVLAWQSSARRATLDAPVEGPAIYTGILTAPPGRTTTTGTATVASWWWVETIRKNNVTVHCSATQRDGLSLLSGSKQVRLTFMSDDDSKVSLLADTRDDWLGASMIDLGSSPVTNSKTILGEAAKCAGDGRVIYERWIPPNTTVDVVACYENGELGPCKGGPLVGILAVGSEKQHRQRRADHALQGAERVALLASIVLLVSTILVARMRAKLAPEGQAEGPAT